MTAALLVLVILPQEEAVLERLVRRANDTRRPPAMGQAIQRLIKSGSKAVPAIEKFVEAKGHNALSLAFTGSLGEIDDERIADLVVELIEDNNFFWRPAAARSLALLAEPEHRELLRGLLDDRLWGVRSAAIRGLEKLDDRPSKDAIRKLLADEIYDVRGQAAKTLWAFEDESGLPVLVEALREATFWFDIDYGQVAREDAWKFLKKISGDDFGLKPWESEKRRAPGVARWDAWMTKRDADWRKKIPEKARAKKDVAEYSFGFELRSCQKGEFFFRIDTERNLVLGCYNLVRAKLTEEELKEFRTSLESVQEVDNTLPYGEGGCDFEQYYLSPRDGKYDRLWIGLGGRPDVMETFVSACRRLIEKKFGSGHARDFLDKTSLFRGSE